MFSYPSAWQELLFMQLGLGLRGGTVFLILVVGLAVMGTWVLVEADSDPS